MLRTAAKLFAILSIAAILIAPAISADDGEEEDETVEYSATYQLWTDYAEGENDQESKRPISAWVDVTVKGPKELAGQKVNEYDLAFTVRKGPPVADVKLSSASFMLVDGNERILASGVVELGGEGSDAVRAGRAEVKPVNEDVNETHLVLMLGWTVELDADGGQSWAGFGYGPLADGDGEGLGPFEVKDSTEYGISEATERARAMIVIGAIIVLAAINVAWVAVSMTKRKSGAYEETFQAPEPPKT